MLVSFSTFSILYFRSTCINSNYPQFEQLKKRFRSFCFFFFFFYLRDSSSLMIYFSRQSLFSTRFSTPPLPRPTVIRTRHVSTRRPTCSAPPRITASGHLTAPGVVNIRYYNIMSRRIRPPQSTVRNSVSVLKSMTLDSATDQRVPDKRAYEVSHTIHAGGILLFACCTAVGA